MTHEKQERIQGQGGAKHTPGPWKLDGPWSIHGQGHTKDRRGEVIDVVTDSRDERRRGIHVASVGRVYGAGAPLNDEDAANAKLIAASPELADALGDVVAELLRSPLDLSLAALLAPGSPLCERVIAASAALRKAGRE